MVFFTESEWLVKIRKKKFGTCLGVALSKV